jgi:hypothetical protein
MVKSHSLSPRNIEIYLKFIYLYLEFANINFKYVWLEDYLLEVKVVSIFIKEFFITYFFCNHAAPTFRAEDIKRFSGKEHEPTHITYIFVRQSHLFSSSFQYNQGFPYKRCV